MIILSWNIQNGKGCDGVVSLERIAEVIRDMCDPDVICFQEVSRGLCLAKGSPAPDQPSELAALFQDYAPVFGVAVEAVDAAGNPWQFGNLTLSRLPILSSFRHPLPQPAEPAIRHMPRQATEITVDAPHGPLRVINTHLEFHSQSQRSAQLARLRELQRDAVANIASPPAFDLDGPYQEIPRPADCVLCGDFNMGTDFDEFDLLTMPEGEFAPAFADAWQIARGNAAHDPTCGIFDHVQWPEGAHCRDFFFVTERVAKVVHGVTVNTRTDASDHQPLFLTLALD